MKKKCEYCREFCETTKDDKDVICIHCMILNRITHSFTKNKTRTIITYSK